MSEIVKSSTKWYASSGFWNGVILAFGGLVIGFPAGDARDVVAALFALFASGNAIREALRGAKFNLKEWLKNGNTWNYLGATVIAIFPMIPIDLFPRIGELVSAALGGNWQGIITALFSIGTMLYFWLKPKPTPVPLPNNTK
jgi:hypothetical protein